VGLRQLTALNQLTGLGFGTFYSPQLDTLATHLMKDKLPGNPYQYAIINKVCDCCIHNKVCVLYGSCGADWGYVLSCWQG